MLSGNDLCGSKVWEPIECLYLIGFTVAFTGRADSDRLKTSELELYIAELIVSVGETLTPYKYGFYVPNFMSC